MTPRIFVSHSSTDLELVKLVVELLETALEVRPGDIRCTSLPGYRLAAGAPTRESIRTDILGANVLLAVISRKSFASAWVLFEMGARWGGGRQLLPLLGPGVEPDILHGPAQDYNALSCSVEPDLEQLLKDIGRETNLSLRPRKRYLHLMRVLVNLRAELTGPENQAKVLRFLREHPGHMIQPGVIGSEVGLDRRVVREIAALLENEGWVKSEVRQFGRVYQLSDESSG